MILTYLLYIVLLGSLVLFISKQTQPFNLVLIACSWFIGNLGFTNVEESCHPLRWRNYGVDVIAVYLDVHLNDLLCNDPDIDLSCNGPDLESELSI